MPLPSVTLAIRQARRACGMSQHELARRMRLKQPAISRIENGLRRVSVLELIALAEALRIDPVALFRRVLSDRKILSCSP
jgi:transcriptional regulator with XRE-family HTH domain